MPMQPVLLCNPKQRESSLKKIQNSHNKHYRGMKIWMKNILYFQSQPQRDENI